MTKEERAFIRGYVSAICNLITIHGDCDKLVREVFSCEIVSYEMLVEAGCGEYDMQIINQNKDKLWTS